MNADDVEATVKGGTDKDPIKIIVDLCKKNEMDPWNIDVIEITDKFLEEIKNAENLAAPGKILHYAAILVRMKSEILTTEDEEEEEDSQPEFIPDEVEFDIPELQLIPRKRAKRWTTLAQLLFALQSGSKSIKPKKSVRRINKILSLPHEEDLEEKILEVEKELADLFEKNGKIYFSEIVPKKDKKEQISYFLSIQYLYFRNRLSISQRRLYGKLEIRRSTGFRRG